MGAAIRVVARPASWAICLALAGGAVVWAQAPQSDAATAQSAIRNQFNGLWAYNQDESVDAATGRPELGPTGANRRGRESGRAPGGLGGGGGGFGGGGGGGGFGGGGGGGGFGGGGGGGGFGGGGFGGGEYRPPSGAAIISSINRALRRDLLEVPQTLSVSIESASVTLVDDLERSYTFPTDNSKHEYIVSAAKFDARARWDEARFVKDIEAARGFKMVETYFLSADGRRMFVVIRLGDQPPPEGVPVSGVNRVYDRVVR